MNHSLIFLVCLLLFLYPLPGRTQSNPVPADSARQMNNDSSGRKGAALPVRRSIDDDEFNPGVFVAIVVFLSVIFCAVFVGCLLALGCLAAIFVLVTAGILSVSAFIGLYKKSFSAAFKSLVTLFSAAGGAIVGAASFWLINRLFHLHATTLKSFWLGSGSGLIGGLLCGLILLKLIAVTLDYFRRKWSVSI